MATVNGRQWGESLAEIRRDHRDRYAFAATLVRGRVLDAGCGCGYGAFVLATGEKVESVKAVDVSRSATEWGEEHFGHPKVTFFARDIFQVGGSPGFDWIVCFEVLEHLRDPLRLLRRFRHMTPRLILSVPNQDVLPFDRRKYPYHERHFTEGELADLLASAGWRVGTWLGQGTAVVETLRPTSRTLLALCERSR